MTLWLETAGVRITAFAAALAFAQILGCSTAHEGASSATPSATTAFPPGRTWRLPSSVWRRLPNCEASTGAAYSLTDFSSGAPLLLLSDGIPEVFLLVRGCQGDVNVRFVGFFSGQKVAISHAPGEKLSEVPVVRIGGRYRLRDTSRSVLVEPSCCDAETPTYARGTPKSRIYDDLTEQLQLFTKDERGQAHQDCLPLRYPVFVLTADQAAPAWVKLFGVKHAPPLDGVRCSDAGTALVEDRVELGAHIGDGSVLATINSPGGQVVFRLDLRTGQPIGKLPDPIHVLDFADVRDFRNDFRRRHTCSSKPPLCPDLKGQYEQALLSRFFD